MCWQSVSLHIERVRKINKKRNPHIESSSHVKWQSEIMKNEGAASHVRGDACERMGKEGKEEVKWLCDGVRESFVTFSATV